MDFSSVGSVEAVVDGFRARVQVAPEGSRRQFRGPRRPDEKSAQKDLHSMRAAANGKSREEGFSAMEAEAKRLRDRKAR